MKYMAILVALALSPSVTFAESAEVMLSACREVASARVSENTAEIPEDFDSGMCWGAFAATQKAIVITNSRNASEGPVLGVCAPSESNRTQLIAVFIEYARTHPERLHEDFFLVALDALRKAFPCGQAK
jgi:hypothetical protein